MEIIRHVAKIAYTGSNADQRCVVAMMQIPQRPDHALVIPTDNLPPKFEQAVMDILKTDEGQQAESFADVLSRHLMPDTGETILAALHHGNKLLPVPVNNVMMLPKPNQPVKLSFILEQLGRLPQQQVSNLYETEKFNPHAHNQNIDSTEQSRAIARNMIIEAEMLEAEANKKREAAYKKDPSLRNKTRIDHKATVASTNSNDLWGDSVPSVITEMEQNIPPVIGEMRKDPVEARLAALEEMITNLVSLTKDKAPVETDKVSVPDEGTNEVGTFKPHRSSKTSKESVES